MSDESYPRWRRVFQKLGWPVAHILFSILLMLTVSFFVQRVLTRMMIEHWASYAGTLQAKVYIQEGKFRILELAGDQKSEFTGRREGPFEIWTHVSRTNSSFYERVVLPVTGDLEYIAAFNRRMREHVVKKAKQTNAATVIRTNPPPVQ
jgi:hypothetical protein